MGELTQLLKDRIKTEKQGSSTSGIDYKIRQSRQRMNDTYKTAEEQLESMDEKESAKRRKALDKLMFKL